MQEVQEKWVQSLGQEDPLEEGMAPLQYSCLENIMDKEAWWAIYSSWGCKESEMTEVSEHEHRLPS